ncbi:hypothetical protein C2G38_2057448 [Gigaspora rosea]|uniref:F-box domain-containing protein n=1 Tax=Gigaspora rosea TaxID=44941 RepID=A0A397WBD1_9GLOM|nr:hypothetical protein C2G38_2057448 [Gigaspora rosea]
MIQILPNELQIEILNYVVIETNFQDFCTLRIVCKKWNAFVPLVMHKAVVSRLNSGLKLELTFWNDTKTKKLAPTYNDYTKTFTFQFDNLDDDINEPLNDNKISFIAFVKRSEDVLFPTKLGAELGDLTFPDFVNNDMCIYEFDNRSNVCFKQETKEDEEGKSIICVKLYSFTIEAWKLFYILDCLKFDTEISSLREGFRYADWVDWWDEYCKWWCEYFYNNFEYNTL